MSKDRAANDPNLGVTTNAKLQKLELLQDI